MLALQVLVHHGCHFGIQRRQDLVHHLYECDLYTIKVQVFGQLDADKAAADDHGPPGLFLVDVRLDRVCVGDAAQRKDARQVTSWHRGYERSGPRREHQLVVGFCVHLACPRVLDRDELCLTVDLDGCVVYASIDVKDGAERLWRLHQKRVAIGNYAADIVGQATVGKGNVGTSLQQHDIGVFVHPPHSCGNARTTGDAADDYQFHSDLLVRSDVWQQMHQNDIDIICVILPVCVLPRACRSFATDSRIPDCVRRPRAPCVGHPRSLSTS